MLGPSLGLGWLAYRQFRLLYVTEPVWIAVAVCVVPAAAISLLVSRADRQEMSDGLMLVATGAMGLAWAFGLTAAINTDLAPRNIVLTPRRGYPQSDDPRRPLGP